MRPLPQPPKSELVMLGTEIDGVPAFTGAGLWNDPAAWHCDQAQIDIAKTRRLMQRIVKNLTPPRREPTDELPAPQRLS
jgi:hypothetical protein